MNHRTAARDRSLLVLLWLLILALLALVLWFHWPYLAREHQRLEPWKVSLIWLNDLTALFWFVWFGLVYLFLGRSLPEAVDPGEGFDRAEALLIVTFLLSLGADFAISWQGLREEKQAFARGQIAIGQVTAYHKSPNAMNDLVDCEFTDDKGDAYQVTFPWAGSKLDEVNRRLEQGLLPMPISITYDPTWPQRNWITGLTPSQVDRLHHLSLTISCLQLLICLPLLLRQKGRWHTAAGSVPLNRFLPLLAVLITLTIGLVVIQLGGHFW